MTQGIKDKVVVITGASSGLGEATARLLSAQGASVVLGARRADRLQSLANELTGSGGKALAITTDVTHCDQVKRLVDAAVQTYGRIDARSSIWKPKEMVHNRPAKDRASILPARCASIPCSKQTLRHARSAPASRSSP